MKLLVVTQYFPPAAGSGVLRGAKFVKYLLREGWEIEVVTIDPAAFPDRDETLLDDVAGAQVFAATLSSVPGVRHVVLRALPSMRRLVGQRIRRFRPDVVLATAPDLHWAVVAAAARRRRVPLVLDYPDPWTILPEDFRLWRPSKLRSRLKWTVAPWVERRVLARARAATFATEPILDEYARRVPRLMRIGRVMSNGFDPEDFDAGAGASPPDRVVVSHIGSFGGPRTPLPAAGALRRAVDVLGVSPASVELALVGAGAEPYRDRLVSILGDIRLRLTGWVPHARAIEEMTSASVLWLDAMVHLRSAATGKLYEYLAAGRPIVALAHRRSPAADLVRRFDAGRVVTSEDPDAAGAALAEVIRSLPTQLERPQALAAFDRGVIAERMSAVLRAVAGIDP